MLRLLVDQRWLGCYWLRAGPHLIYVLNAISFLAVILALLLMRSSGSPELQGERRDALSLAALKEGFKFVWKTPDHRSDDDA